LGQKINGGTTIAGTMVLARLAGIRVFGTGGLGGVHRGGESTLDISADLTELGRTRMAVISSGCKGFLDIPRTLEYLETQGVLVSTFTDGRHGKVDFPAFWARDSGVRSPFVVHTEEEAAAIILAQESLGIESGLLFANPIPEQFSIPRDEMNKIIQQAVRESEEQGASGSENTPFILKRIRELTSGRSVPANKALVRANVKRASKIAVAVSQMISGDIAVPVQA
jgi:pseudouridylate synthase / pseudouridine kinase